MRRASLSSELTGVGFGELRHTWRNPPASFALSLENRLRGGRASRRGIPEFLDRARVFVGMCGSAVVAGGARFLYNRPPLSLAK